MSFLTTLLRFTVLAVIVLCALQLGVLAMFRTDTPPTIAEIPVPLKVYEFRAKILDWLAARIYEEGRKMARKSTARNLSGLSLEERQQYLEEFRKILTEELREYGLADLTDQGIDDFIKEMNKRGVYFE